MRTEDGQIIQQLLERYGREPMSKTHLLMAIHYYLRDKCDIYGKNFDSLDKKVGDLVDAGVIQEIGTQSYQIA